MSADDKTPEPHPLPLTRQWVEDYKRYGTGPKPVGCPDLQALVERAGRRHAASIGEQYEENPFKRPPHQGGYSRITAAEWIEYDRAMGVWQAARRPRR